MKKIIISIICSLAIFLVLFNINKISNFLVKIITNNKVIIPNKSNNYTKDYNFLYVQKNKDFVPYCYSDLINILYSILNQRLENYTFYCPSEYENCINDISRLSKNELELSYINNFVHPYNSFQTIKIAFSETREVIVDIKYLYDEKEINAINEYIDKTINDLYKENDNDYQNLKRIHDFIALNTQYDIEKNNTGKSQYHSSTAYGPATEGYATCNGYADLMAIILSKLNYQNYKIATVKEEISNESSGHIWNAVKINDNWLHLDLTWDDPVGTDGKNHINHNYFLVSTLEMQKADRGNVAVDEHNFNSSVYREFFNS